MTKDDEIKILEAAAAALGNNSYCGPWLMSILGEIRSEIGADIGPLATVADNRKV